jgi:hypothetical protein
MVGRIVTADNQGLISLPKPLIAHVERDHFVAVVRADAKGVSYFCSDCGCWPGGRVNLTWKQWHALDPGVYVTVSQPGSRADRLLAALLSARGGPAPLRLAAAGSLSRLHLSRVLQASSLLALLKGHVIAFLPLPGTAITCGGKPDSLRCPPWVGCPKDGNCGGGAGPAAGEPVNLATGEEEYQPAPDLTVYNPHGPAIVWRRIYNSLRGPDLTYESDDFGIGWSHPYNVTIHDANAYTNPQVPAGGSTVDLTVIGQHAPAGGLVWDVVRGGSTIATSTSSNGWSVTYVPSPPSNLLRVSAPTSAGTDLNYEVRYYSSSLSLYASAFYDVCPASSCPQGATIARPVGGSDAPGTGLQWDVVLGGNTVATSARPRGWAVKVVSAGSPIPITPPLSAPMVSNYEVRVNTGSGMNSAFFNVVQNRFQYTTGTKTLIPANGARIDFTASSMPAAGQPVSCSTGLGVPLTIEWDYDGSAGGHYTISFADQSRWITTGATHSSGVLTVDYQLAQIQDRNGNALDLNYGDPGDPPSLRGAPGYPLLTSIADHSTTNALLTIQRKADATGNIENYHRSRQPLPQRLLPVRWIHQPVRGRDLRLVAGGEPGLPDRGDRNREPADALGVRLSADPRQRIVLTTPARVGAVSDLDHGALAQGGSHDERGAHSLRDQRLRPRTIDGCRQ